MNRISEIAKLCQGTNTLLDVGCDHGYVICEAILKYNVKYAIGTDINPLPLENARLNLEKNNLLDKTSLILTDGIKDVNSNFDTVVIAGMGAILIKKILEDSYLKIKDKKIIIEANNNRDIIRNYLCNNGFYIEDEKALYDKDKYYEIIVFMPGHKEYSDLDLKYGPILMKNKPKDFIKYYRSRIEFTKNIIKNMNDLNMIKSKEEEINTYYKIIGE